MQSLFALILFAPNVARRMSLEQWRLPQEFKLTELQEFFEHLTGFRLDKRNFRKVMKRTGRLEPVGEKHTPYRNPMVYRWV